MRVLEELESAVRRLPGPTPNFNLIHAVMLLMILEGGAMGRKRISEVMGIGEGTARSLISRLRESGYVEVDRTGCRLSRRGRRELRELRRHLLGPREVVLSELHRGGVVVFMVRRAGLKPMNVVELRDEAVRAGGRGAIILLHMDGKLVFPETMEPVGKYGRNDELTLKEALDPGDGDILVIGLGDSPREAKMAALAVSLVMLR